MLLPDISGTENWPVARPLPTQENTVLDNRRHISTHDPKVQPYMTVHAFDRADIVVSLWKPTTTIYRVFQNLLSILVEVVSNKI
jgi:hypothetical protein